MYIIAGLGNPGEEYENTRHNAGRIVLEAVRKAFATQSFGGDFSEWKEDKKIRALVSDGKVGAGKKAESVKLVMPETFMNKSGQSVAPVIMGAGAGAGAKTANAKKAAQLVVVYDDLDLPVGRIKISFNRSSGGHKGVESIIRALKTEAFVRIRVGISPTTATGKLRKPQGDAVVGDFILAKFKDAEMAEIKKVAKRAAQAVEMIVTEGHEKAMGEFNSI